MVSSYYLAVVGTLASLVAHGLSSPLSPTANTLYKRGEQLALNRDFPDPSIEQVSYRCPESLATLDRLLTFFQDWDGTWYAFSTSSKPIGNYNIQIAKAPSPDGPWTYVSKDALPNPGTWTTGTNTVSSLARTLLPSSLRPI